MEMLIDKLTHNPVILAIAVVLALFIIFAFMKRLIKFALFLLALLVLYFAYLIFTGKDIPTTPAALKESVGRDFKGVGNAFSKKVDELGKSVKEKAEESVEEKVDELFDGKVKEK